MVIAPSAVARDLLVPVIPVFAADVVTITMIIGDRCKRILNESHVYHNDGDWK